MNRASLLTNLAASGEILVGTCTMASASGFFFFEKGEYNTGRSTAETIDAYRVLSTVKKPDKIRRVQGLRARLIGRRAQMKTLFSCLSDVAQGRGTCVFLAGDAGTGKSRLISEFKNALVRRHVRWLQGNAFTYTQSVPYFPLIDLLGRAVDLRDEDSQAVARQKLADELKPVRGEDKEIFQIIDRLFTIPNDSPLKISPESWKIKLKQTLERMIDIQSRTGLTVICIEDLHWADPSTVTLLQRLLNEADLSVFSRRDHQLACRHGIPAEERCYLGGLRLHRRKSLFFQYLRSDCRKAGPPGVSCQKDFTGGRSYRPAVLPDDLKKDFFRPEACQS